MGIAGGGGCPVECDGEGTWGSVTSVRGETAQPMRLYGSECTQVKLRIEL